MQTSMKPLFTGERAMRFLEVTVVHSMEGMLFALLSALFTLAGAAACFEDFGPTNALAEASAAAPAVRFAETTVVARAPAARAR
jgi:hypothetical protein